MFFLYKSSEFLIIKRVKYFKALLIPLIKLSGRSNCGRLIFLGRGGGFKKYYRLIDFKRLIWYIPCRIIKFEYDPNRNLFLMFLVYLNGVIVYSLAPLLVKVNMYLSNNNFFSIKNGTAFLLANCLVGSFIHCVKINSLICKYARSAGVFIQIIRKLGNYVLLRLASKEELFLFNKNLCILGRLSNVNVKLIKQSNAGYNRRLGFKSKVRGVAKNPIDHPHGGGSGRTTAGQPSVTPWGVYTKGVRSTTRYLRFSLIKWGFFKRRTGLSW